MNGNHAEPRGMTMNYLSHETRRDMIVTHAWETWTKNGLNMDKDQWAETTKTVQDKVDNAYHDGITDTDWLAATLKSLNA
jgi:membrane-associated HD superfamily phosphohydrolase